MACLWSIHTPTLIDIVRTFLCQECFEKAYLPDCLGYSQMWPLPTNPPTKAACQALRNAQTGVKDTLIISCSIAKESTPCVFSIIDQPKRVKVIERRVVHLGQRHPHY
jgi:hypothetical protein